MGIFSKVGLGIDIGTTSIKVVELVRSGDTAKLSGYGILENYAHLERINEAIQTSSFKIVEKNTAQYLSNLLKQSKIKSREANVSLPSFYTYMNLIELPILTRQELEKAVYYQARQYVPISLNDVILDWQIVKKTDTRIYILLTAVPKDIIEKYTIIGKLANVKIKSIELEIVSQVRSLLKNEKGLVAIVDIGGRATSIAIIDEGIPQLIRTIDTAGGDLTQVVATGLAISPIRAEEIKRLYGLASPRGQEDISRIMMPLLGVIKQEILREISNFNKKTNRIVEKIYLTGGIANLPGIIDDFMRDLRIQVIKGDPFALKIVNYDKMIEPVIREIGTSLSCACGLALREFL